VHEGLSAYEDGLPLSAEDTARLLRQIAALVDALGEALAGQMIGGRHLVDALSDQLADGQVETLYTLSSAVAAFRRHASEVTERTSQAGDQIAAATALSSQDIRDSVEAALVSAEARLALSTQQLTAATESAIASVNAASAAGAATIEAAAVRSAGHIEAVARDMAGELGVAAEDFLVGFTNGMAAADQRDARAERRGEARVQRLVDRADAALAAATSALAEQTARLEARDAELERQRTAEFVRVLDEILGRAGARGRDLRDRVRGVLDRERTAEPPAPAPSPPEPVANPRPRTSRRKPGAKEIDS
jgi:NADH dehydrogenase/NADH:ubiquinone oxidoreductase subunit G